VRFQNYLTTEEVTVVIEKEVTMQELIDVLGMKTNEPESYDITGYGLEIESYNVDTAITEFKPVTEVLVKHEVPKHYVLGELKGSANHRVLFNGEYIPLKDHPDATLINEPLSIVDISVEDNENYVANGVVNHNTTSGGR
jgi:intein/homing endonuclease